MNGDEPQMSPLQRLVVTRLAALGDRSGPALSGREAARRSKGLVTHSTVAQIVRGTHTGRIEDKTARGLAIALDVPLSKVYEAAGLPQPIGPWQWPERFERLDMAERRLVEDVAGALLEAWEKGRRAQAGDE